MNNGYFSRGSATYMYLMESLTRRAAPVALALIGILLASPGWARDITLEEAINIATERTPRGGIIKGNLDVAEQTYFARRVNFYVPEVSINGSLPSYSENQSYDYFYGFSGKNLFKSTKSGLASDITLKQNLLTGGDFTVSANLSRSRDRSPIGQDTLSGQIMYSNFNSRQGDFNFTLAQPLLKPSDAKNELNNRKDDLALAQLTLTEERGKLEKEVVEAYLGLLQTSLQKDLADVSLQSTTLKARNDSSMLNDGIISEDKWLESSSKRLDAELNRFDISNQLAEKNRQLMALLDLNDTEQVNLSEPSVANIADSNIHQRIDDGWSTSLNVKRAEFQFRKSKRAADYAESSHGLSGNLLANYSFGRGKAEKANGASDNLNTNRWGVSLNFNLPVWDGGASSASVKAARLQAESSRLEYEKAQKAARAELESLLNKLDVSYRKLSLIRQQITIAQSKVDIAQKRFDNGEISELTFLDSRIFYLQTKDKYYTELKSYLLNRIDLKVKLNG
jgi:outer membrane protein